jgi:AraC family transcriptional regulator
MTRVAAVAPDGRCYTQAVVGPFEVTRLAFPPAYRHGAFEPERGYIVVVLQGSVCKTFSRDSATLGRGDVATLPAGSTHSSAFAPGGTQVLTVRAADESALFGSLLDRRRHVHASASTGLGWRMAMELEATDACWALALEGLALQLVATAERASCERAGPWLTRVRELLHDRAPEQASLGELADAVGRHPTHVARVFRREYGLSVGEYARSLRLEWAASRLALDDAPLAQVALEAGFADQSHFTRAFRRHTGVTPGRYRELRRVRS